VPGYLIVKCLGQRVNGEVWLATQHNNPAHRVAVKFFIRRSGNWLSMGREVEKLKILTTDRYIAQLLVSKAKIDAPRRRGGTTC
jgi:hypothetical protein